MAGAEEGRRGAVGSGVVRGGGGCECQRRFRASEVLIPFGEIFGVEEIG